MRWIRPDLGNVATALRRPSTYTGQVRELATTARVAARYPFGLVEAALSTGRPAGDVTRDTPVLLVHGYGHNRSGWFLLHQALRRTGFTSVHTLNYVAWGAQGVPGLSERLAARVEAVRDLTGFERVHLVGHSLGGILLRWYVQELGGDQTVDTAVTIASPHAGTVLARLGPGPAARDLRPGSWVMRRLASGARPTTVRWIALYSNLDLLVQPGGSARLDHPALSADNVFVKDLGHLGMLLSPAVVRTVVQALERAQSPSSPA